MQWTRYKNFISVALLGCMCVLPSYAQAKGGSDAQIQAEVAKALSNKRFSSVQSTVKHGEVFLSGTVDVFSSKEEADRRVHRVKGINGVQNTIAIVSSSKLTDEELRDKLAEKLAYDRVGYGTTAFNAFTISVQAGAVTLGGVAYGPMDRDSAVALVSNYPGVQDVIDNIEVAPPSPNDDRIRLQVARAVYGYAPLNKYSIDPAKPIRITVVNGNVTLSGVVNNQADKDAAGMRANSVPGVFKVTNVLDLANAPAKEQ